MGDAKTLDAWLRTPRGQVIRPTLVSWQDWRSRAAMGFTIVPHGNEDAILQAFASATEKHGLPSYAIIDNGRDYSAWSWTGGKPKRSIVHKAGEPFDQLDGLFALAGITPSYCLPYSPNGKARLERWHRTIDDQVTRSFPSWCGNCPEDRPEAHAKLVAKAVEWDYFLKTVGRFVAIYNDRAHGADDMQGRSPLQCLALAPRKRVLDDNTRLMLLSKWHRPVSIGRNGVTIRIAGSSQSYGANQPELQALPIGTKVRVAYTPDDLGQIAIWTLAGSFVCQASLNQKLNRKVPSEALREAMRAKGRAKRALKQARKGGLMYLRDPVELALSGLAADGEQRRVPDDPEGGKPNIMPVQSPIETPQRMRKAVGAEELDMNARLAEFNRKGKEAGKGRTESAWSKLCDKYGGRS